MRPKEKRPVKHSWKYWLRLLNVGLLGGIILSCLAIELFYIVSVTRPAPSVVGEPPQKNNGIEYQPVTLYNEKDDIHLKGWYIPSQNRAAVILLHGFQSDRLAMKSRAEVLARHGYGVLLYDLRGHGESEGEVRAFGWQDVEDVHAALEFLSKQKEVDPERIGLLGFSIGGQIAIRATAEYLQIKALIADDPGFVSVEDAPKPATTREQIFYAVSWVDGRGVSLWTGIPIPAGVPEVLGDVAPRPILFIDTGRSEGRALVRHFYEIADEPKELWEIPEASHGAQFRARPAEYEERMIHFFEAFLLKK